MYRPPMEDFSLKETKPHLGGGKVTGDKLTSTYDLVEQMQYLYVRVVKAKDLPGKDVTGSCDPYVEIKLGNYKGTTRHFEKKSNPEWNQVFAFSKDRIQASVLEVTVKDKDFVKDDFIGRVLFDLNEVPKRVPPDSPLAPQWYRLEERNGNKAKGELMLAVWMGTQADEAFPEAWHSDAATVSGADGLANIRSKVYLSPKLWYLRVNVIEAQDLMPGDKSRFPEVFVKAILGNQALRTRISMNKSINPMWNEDLMFVAAEPFEEPLILSVEDRVAPNKDEVLGRCAIPLQYVDRRLDHKAVNTRWYNLEKHVIVEGEKKKEVKFASRIHMRICLEGGYHVLDESTHYSSDLRPTAKQLWKSSIGVLELGILNAHGLSPMKTKDGRATTDAYCVAKYGQKWVRTRTIIDSFMPRWNEQYTWEIKMEGQRIRGLGRWRPRHPPHMDTRLSCADNALPDELDEEFDTFPTSRPNDHVRMRYDRLRSIAGRIQTVVGDLATQGERFQSLLSWRDPRATALFVIFCLVAAIVLYVTPFQVVALLAGFYVLRHPRFRHKLPSVPLNFFRRLPARTDCML
ncbi:calcium-dependent lipid-binding (CaLB domain) plant phosphoribosyltransferase family protein [Actinidia rufa]|uniref:Calcium-dependent lipid-binding (CaLB domain) plant phosphoribosyltransferase family protein n=1 Tax=Actinidia rufa TaxID=165716 RepID=A0A7J0FC76_9ERIC|nr:calcium-dependent lipid-binding (CaLB domain) plant phosphoribosyltransferase family protein [Actinidia rufa]